MCGGHRKRDSRTPPEAPREPGQHPTNPGKPLEPGVAFRQPPQPPPTHSSIIQQASSEVYPTTACPRVGATGTLPSRDFDSKRSEEPHGGRRIQSLSQKALLLCARLQSRRESETQTRSSVISSCFIVDTNSVQRSRTQDLGRQAIQFERKVFLIPTPEMPSWSLSLAVCGLNSFPPSVFSYLRDFGQVTLPHEACLLHL